ncbi:hypothetical protein ACFW7J_13145 [Streptomyces sp. NPDC059525]|uniref:hypothetical protein n=1 Tax=Streptomyces sp. NPDC059525 TaxID=3346857 RepID=UPI0036CD4D8E
MSEPVVNPSCTCPQPDPARRVWPWRLLVAATLVSPVPVTLLVHAAPGWGDAVQAGFTPAQWLLVLAFAEWSRLRR